MLGKGRTLLVVLHGKEELRSSLLRERKNFARSCAGKWKSSSLSQENYDQFEIITVYNILVISNILYFIFIYLMMLEVKIFSIEFI